MQVRAKEATQWLPTRERRHFAYLLEAQLAPGYHLQPLRGQFQSRGLWFGFPLRIGQLASVWTNSQGVDEPDFPVLQSEHM